MHRKRARLRIPNNNKTRADGLPRQLKAGCINDLVLQVVTNFEGLLVVG